VFPSNQMEYQSIGIKIDMLFAILACPLVRVGSCGLYLMVNTESDHLVLARSLKSLCPSFDIGHLGHELVDYTALNLPVLIQSALESHLSSSKSDLQHNSEEISSLLKQCIVSFDESILGDLASFFPRAHSGGISDEDIKEIVNNVSMSGPTSGASGSTSTNYAKILRSLQGATALIVLINPESDELWVANLGDCQAGECGFPLFFWTVFGTSITDFSASSPTEHIYSFSKFISRVQADLVCYQS